MGNLGHWKGDNECFFPTVKRLLPSSSHGCKDGIDKDALEVWKVEPIGWDRLRSCEQCTENATSEISCCAIEAFRGRNWLKWWRYPTRLGQRVQLWPLLNPKALGSMAWIDIVHIRSVWICFDRHFCACWIDLWAQHKRDWEIESCSRLRDSITLDLTV